MYFSRGRMLRISCALGLLVAGSLGLGTAAAENPPIAGLGPIGPVVKVQGDFKFLEGPAADAHGDVFFTDIPNSRVHKLDVKARTITVFREPSGSMNGTMFNAAGELVGCEMEGRVVALNARGEVVRVVTDKHDGKRYNAPNDLVLDSAGGVYFTDPHFRAPEPLPQGVTAVYYAAADGQVTRLVSDLKAPNGVILSPDEKTLYVVPTLQAEMWAYPVTAPGKLGPGRVLCTLQQKEGQSGKGGDGLTVDVKGNLYITSGLGLQVFDPSGKLLGIIELPEQPANVTFGGPDRKTLYCTCRTSLYRVPMEIAGHVFPGGKR